MHNLLLRFVMWNIRWLVYVAGGLVRSFIAWYAARKVVAYGLRDERGALHLVFAPHGAHSAHTLMRTGDARRSAAIVNVPAVSYGPPVLQQFLTEEPVGSTVRIDAQWRHDTIWDTASSPVIRVGAETAYDDALLTYDGTHLRWHWPTAPMVALIAITDAQGNTSAVAHTTARAWEFGTEQHLLHVSGNLAHAVSAPRPLTATLLLINRDMWVTHFAQAHIA